MINFNQKVDLSIYSVIQKEKRAKCIHSYYAYNLSSHHLIIYIFEESLRIPNGIKQEIAVCAFVKGYLSL